MDPAFNRWLLELTKILNASGGIDNSQITGFTALQSSVSTLQSQMTTVQATQATHTTQITTANTNITTLQGQMTTANSNIAALQARGYVTHGSGAPGSLAVGVLYINDSGSSGTRLYANIGGTVTALA
jgi:hypothetical protein